MLQGKQALRTLRTYFFPIGATIFWGANFNAGKVAILSMPAITVAAWRFVLAAIGISCILLLKERPRWAHIRSNALIYIVLGICGVFGTNSLVYLGLRSTSAVNASLVMATNPLVTMLLSAWLLRESVAYRQLFGFALSLMGVIFVLTNGTWTNIQAISIGDLSVLGGNICFALYGVLGRKYLAKDSSLNRSAFPMIVGALCFLPFAFLPAQSTSVSLLTEAWLAIIYMAVFGSIISYLLWNKSISQIGLGKTASFFHLVPVATMVVAIITGSGLTLAQLIGALFVVAGILLGESTVKKVLVEENVLVLEVDEKDASEVL